VAKLTEPWDDPEAEHRALVEFVLPLARAGYDLAIHRWTSLDAKAFGFLAVVAAVIGGLAAVHDAIHPAWWGPAAGSAVAGFFFIRALWLRDISLGPDVIDVHDETRVMSPTNAARAVVESLLAATQNVEDGYDDKSWNFNVGLAIMSVSFLGALPVVVFGS
jgi:hypothetical protein